MYLRSDVLLSANVFKNFRKMCIKMHELDPAKFLSASGLTLPTALKKTAVESKFLTDIIFSYCLEKELVEEYVMQFINSSLCES